jgi:hypothetical protein
MIRYSLELGERFRLPPLTRNQEYGVMATGLAGTLVWAFPGLPWWVRVVVWSAGVVLVTAGFLRQRRP